MSTLCQKTLPDLTTFRGRLEHLAVLLDEIHALDRPFDLASWFAGAADDCGTAACALGWACRDPAFQAQGLGAATRFDAAPMFEGVIGFPAAMRFFGLTYLITLWLFCIEAYFSSATAADVAARVRALL